MTWAKLSDDFSDDTARARLSDAAFRTHVEGILWVMRRETGGGLDALDVRRFAETPDPEAAIKELCDASFWEATADGWRILHHMDVQISPEVMERRRQMNADRQRRHREKSVGLGSEPDHPQSATQGGVTDPVTRDVTQHETRDPGLVWSGLDGTGSSSSLEEKTLKDKTLKNPSSKTATPRSPRSRNTGDAQFDAWWEQYPKKVGKQAAKRAYVKALKFTTPEVLLDSLEPYKAYMVRENKTQYYKDPATWLNAGCWEDDHGPVPELDVNAILGRDCWSPDIAAQHFNSLEEEMKWTKEQYQARREQRLAAAQEKVASDPAAARYKAQSNAPIRAHEGGKPTTSDKMRNTIERAQALQAQIDAQQGLNAQPDPWTPLQIQAPEQETS